MTRQMFTKMIAALCLLTVAVSAENIIGFDFGSTFFKITLVKPGTPYSIVENVTSARKTHSMWTIADEERMFGIDSFNKQARYPQTSFGNVASMLGVDYNQESLDALRADKFVLNEFVEDERGLVAWQTFKLENKEETEIYYTEEIVASILKYGRMLSERQADGNVVDAVITIPAYFNQEQRRQMVTAATLAGLNVIQLVHENTAAATMFGIDRTDEVPLTVLIYNMGGKDTEVTVARYSTATDEKTNKTHEYIDILGEGWDETLGGQEFEHVIVEILAEHFNGLKERAGKKDVRDDVKALKRLYKEAVKIKEMLSANKHINVKIPELLDYVTLAMELQRSTFEERADHLFNRVEVPLQRALDQAGISVDEIDQVEIIGGGLRVPRVQQILKEKTNGKELHVHLNGDEAMCFGSAFIASNSSSSFRVRKVYLTQHPQYDIKIEVTPVEPADIPTGQDGEEEEPEIVYNKELVLYKRNKDYLGQKKTIALKYDRAMKVDVFAVEPQDTEDAPEVKFPLATYTLNQLDEIANNEVATKEGSTKPKITLGFELSRSHFFKMTKAAASIDAIELEEYEPEPEVVEEELVVEDLTEEDAPESDEAAQDEPEQVEGADAEASEEATDAEQEEVEVEPLKLTREVVNTHTFTIKIEEELHGVRLLNEDQLSDARKRMKALEKRDQDKLKTDEAKNDYESLIYEFRGWLNEDDNAPFVAESDREEFITKCNDGEDWLYEDGSDAGYKEYQTRAYELQSAFSKFKSRGEAFKDREQLVPQAFAVLKESTDKILEIRESKPWISEEEVKDVIERIDELKDWLVEKVGEQSALRLDEDPILSVSEINGKMKKVASLFKKVTEKKKPREKKPKKVETEEESSSDGERSSSEEEAHESQQDQQEEEMGFSNEGGEQSYQEDSDKSDL